MQLLIVIVALSGLLVYFLIRCMIKSNKKDNTIYDLLDRLEEQNKVLVKKEQTKKVEELVVVDIKDVGLDEIKKEYELIYSSDDIELLERFINKYKDNEDVWWFVARIENKIKILKK